MYLVSATITYYELIVVLSIYEFNTMRNRMVIQLLFFLMLFVCQLMYTSFYFLFTVDVRPHFATPDHDAITIQVSNRVTHQIISRIYSIFLREVLGYEYVTIMPVPFKSYANERDQLYYSLESLIKFTHS